MALDEQNDDNNDDDHDDDDNSDTKEEAVVVSSFATLAAELGLDSRLRKAILRLGHAQPMPVQTATWKQTIHHGRDVLVKAPTGSGKTLAYAIPLLHKILKNTTKTTTVQALVLVPTKELCHQVASVLRRLSYYCDEQVTLCILNEKDNATQQASLRDEPNVVVATPSAAAAIRIFHAVETVVIDEADLVLSFGYKDDVATLCQALPNIYQGLLVSATLSPEVETLKQVVLHSPVLIHVEQEQAAAGQLKQFFCVIPHQDKALLLYVFLKLGLLKGKGLFFVGSINAGYKLKLILEQFFVRTAVLNAELPLRSRLNIIEQFNLGSFDYLIATDAGTEYPMARKKTPTRNDGDDGEEEEDDDEETETQEKDHPPRNNKHQDYGVSRGVDFRNVSFVVNVDMPETPKAYAHRIGRTARGTARGVALSLVETSQLDLLRDIQESQPRIALPNASTDTLVAASENNDDDQQQHYQPVPLDFALHELEGFRYRVRDVSQAVTKKKIRESRAAELRAEVLHSERLRLTATDVQALAQPPPVLQRQLHLQHVPDYLLPRGMQVADLKRKRKKKRKRNMRKSESKDPLQNFSGDVTLEGFQEDATEEPEVFTSTTDGTGTSTSGRRAWKERRGKGEFSKKKRMADRKHKAPLGF